MTFNLSAEDIIVRHKKVIKEWNSGEMSHLNLDYEDLFVSN